MGASCSTGTEQVLSDTEDDFDSMIFRVKCSRESNKIDAHGESLTEYPKEFFEARHLRILNLSTNKISVLPHFISVLINLDDFQLFDNELERLPGQISYLTSLKILNLSNNSLSTLPGEIGHLTLLAELLLWGNNLVSLPEEIGKLGGLSLLDGSFNKLTGLPLSIGQLVKLKDLKFSGNHLSSLPASVETLTSLLSADFSHNHLESICPGVCFWIGASKINFGRNKISLLPDQFERLSHLAELNIQNNMISSLPVSICKLPIIKRLICADNKLTSLPEEISNMKTLNMLLLDDNPIEELPETLFGISSLASIQLTNHKLRKLPESLTSSKSIYILTAVNGTLEWMPDNFSAPMNRLCKVDLSNNMLKNVPSSWDGLINLQDLKLYQNNLSSLPESISALINLQYLNICENQISILPSSIDKCIKLKKLFVSYNKLQQLPETITSLKNLQEIHATGNPISKLPDDFSNLSGLKGIWIGKCNFSDDQFLDSIAQLASITTLDISNNMLSILPTTILSKPGLAILDASGTCARELPPELSGRTYKWLDISHSAFTPESFAQLPPDAKLLNETFNNLTAKFNEIPRSLNLEGDYCLYIGRRSEMEDRLCLQNNLPHDSSFFAVFDGHDGAGTANKLQDQFASRLNEFLAKQEPMDALQSTYKEMDKIFKDSMETSGSTALTIIVNRQYIYSANVGDSRGIICRSNGVERITVDHKPYSPDEHTRILASGGFVTDDGRISGVLAVSRSFGDIHLQPFVSPEPYLRKIERSEADEWIVLASDGLWDAVTDEQAANAIRRCKNCREAATLLRDMAFMGDSSDNISIAVLKFPQNQ